MADKDLDKAEPTPPGPGPLERIATPLLTRFRTLLGPSEPEYRPSRPREFYLLTVYVLRRWIVEDRCPGMAASLTIQTLLSTVPLIGVALLLISLMNESGGAALMQQLFHSIVPQTTRAEEMASGALAAAEKVTISNLGAWGFGVTVAIAFVLFQTLERTVNQIWRVTRTRSLFVKFTTFFTLATVGPALMLYSLAHDVLPGVATALGFPLFTSSAALILLYRFLPFTEVRWRGPIIGGLIAATLVELGKYGFGYYAARFAMRTYEGMYGSLALLPLLVVWAYLSWMVMLLGVEISFVIERRYAIALVGYVNRYVLDRYQIVRPSGRTAARLLLAICDQYANREIGLTARALAERFQISLDITAEILTRLEREGLVLEADRPAAVFIPGRPLDQIRLSDVLALFEQDQAAHPRSDQLSNVFGELDEQRTRVVGPLNYAQLVARRRDSGRPRSGESADAAAN